ncbi:hypothetical protein [Nonomuraea turcica]|uniref:hypothetical protein n=1 Tax=Nonomuraea sp. G32 TaxID=3067274 RepID=UPI00273C5882|nr:hypothetical protein [Nonomuraea sp. G32]MDP4501423.1 hypothetical protein [Nonomuraea sp. G32]
MPIPTMTMVVTPTASGTVVFKGGGFALQVGGGSYNCQPTASGSGPAATLVVGTGSTATGTNSPTTSNTPTTTPTTSTPKPTKTSTATVTVTPPEKTEKSKTPKEGADTGAGGEMGPDGRMFILTGTALIAAATVGGLFMRRRNATRG